MVVKMMEATMMMVMVMDSVLDDEKGGHEQRTPWTRELPRFLHFWIYSGELKFLVMHV